jgi:DNA-binding Lrp family transcriptional regulator
MYELDAVDRAIMANLQGNFPLCDYPYAEAAQRVGCTQDELLQRLDQLLAERVLTRFGPLYQVERLGGAFVLAALAVPEARFAAVAELLNQLPAVAHNYRREHALNMWFVLATETPAGIEQAIAEIELASGLPVFAFPKEREYFVEMKLEVCR